MILVTGGKNQGKTAFVKRFLNLEPEEKLPSDWMDGRNDAPEKALFAPVIFHLEELVWRLMKAGVDAESFAKRLMAENKAVVIVTDEIGCGIVPMEAFQREYREIHGRICQNIAAESGQVYRVLCGIAMQIKG